MMKNPDTRFRFSREGNELVQEELVMEKMVGSYIRTYKKLGTSR